MTLMNSSWKNKTDDNSYVLCKSLTLRGARNFCDKVRRAMLYKHLLAHLIAKIAQSGGRSVCEATV
jgi:hypothetical protein